MFIFSVFAPVQRESLVGHRRPHAHLLPDQHGGATGVESVKSHAQFVELLLSFPSARILRGAIFLRTKITRGLLEHVFYRHNIHVSIFLYGVFLKKVLHKRKEKMQEKLKMT